jgi:hypothetical protein
MHVAAGAPVAHLGAVRGLRPRRRCHPLHLLAPTSIAVLLASFAALPRRLRLPAAGWTDRRCNRSELQEAGDPVAAAAAATVTVASGSSRGSSRAGGCGGVTVREVPRGAATAATVFPPARPSLPDEPCSATLRASNADSHSPPLWR